MHRFLNWPTKLWAKYKPWFDWSLILKPWSVFFLLYLNSCAPIKDVWPFDPFREPYFAAEQSRTVTSVAHVFTVCNLRFYYSGFCRTVMIQLSMFLTLLFPRPWNFIVCSFIIKIIIIICWIHLILQLLLSAIHVSMETISLPKGIGNKTSFLI